MNRPTCVVHPDRLAEHPLRVCGGCETTTRTALRDAPGLWADLGDPRRGKSLGGVRGGDKPSPMPDSRLEARGWIRHVLANWCRILEEEFGNQLPADTVRAMAHHVSTQAGRVLASPIADVLVAECRDLLALQRVAWPTRWTGVKVACPSCQAEVFVAAGAEEVRCPNRECEEWGSWQWWLERVMPETGVLMTASESCEWLGRLMPWLAVQPKTVTKWVERSKLPVAERGGEGLPDLFDPVLVARVAMGVPLRPDEAA